MPGDAVQGAGFAPRSSVQGTEHLQNQDWVTDMELMHHYATQAYLTLPRPHEIGRVWQSEAVELALVYQYLLHLILAYSAFHLAHLRPEHQRRYYYAAAQHQSLGLRDMRTDLVGLNAENCHALFMAGSFLALGKFAALTIYAGDKNDHRPNLEDIVEVFVLLKGMDTVLQSWEQAIQAGPFRTLFAMSPSSRPFPFWNEISERLDRLRELLGGRLVDDPARAAVIDSEVLKLSNVSQQSVSFSSAPELRFIVQWPISVSNSYVRMLREVNPAALVVLSYYCVVVHLSETTTWFTRGWASKLLRAVEALLPPEWSEMIQWPLEHIHNSTP